MSCASTFRMQSIKVVVWCSSRLREVKQPCKPLMYDRFIYMVIPKYDTLWIVVIISSPLSSFSSIFLFLYLPVLLSSFSPSSFSSIFVFPYLPFLFYFWRRVFSRNLKTTFLFFLERFANNLYVSHPQFIFFSLMLFFGFEGVTI